MSKSEHAHVSPQLKWSDYVFICLLCINLIGVILLGRNIYIQGNKLEQARKNAELVMAWADGVDEDMDAGKPISPPQCTPATDKDLKTAKFQPNTLGECAASLFGPNGKFPEITNTFMKDGLIYAKKCDLSDFRQAPLDPQWSQSSRILMSYQVEWNLGLIFAIVVFG